RPVVCCGPNVHGRREQDATAATNTAVVVGVAFANGADLRVDPAVQLGARVVTQSLAQILARPSASQGRTRARNVFAVCAHGTRATERERGCDGEQQSKSSLGLHGGTS